MTDAPAAEGHLVAATDATGNVNDVRVAVHLAGVTYAAEIDAEAHHDAAGHLDDTTNAGTQVEALMPR